MNKLIIYNNGYSTYIYNNMNNVIYNIGGEESKNNENNSKKKN